MTLDVRRAGERFHTELDWLDSWHSFSFGPHFDASNTHHGLLVVNNDDVIRGGGGFATHSHRDMEIVTWVLEGELAHRDSTGTSGVIRPGLAQRMSAGRGIAHSETNASATADVHLVQMWVRPDATGVEPGYEQHDLSDELARGGLVTVASGHGRGGVFIHQRQAELLAGRLAAGTEVTVPDAPHVHVFVAVGSGELDGGGTLATGDAVRLTAAGPRAFRAGDGGAEVLVWATA